MIDTHVHIGAHFNSQGRYGPEPGQIPEQSLLYAAENAYVTLMAGFTTVQRGRLPQPLTRLIPQTADRLDNRSINTRSH